MQTLCPESSLRTAPNWPKIRKMTMTSKLFLCFVSLVKFSCWSKFHVNIIIGSGVMLIWNWPEIQKSEIPLSEFCSVSGHWSEQGLPNLARTSIIKCYWMLQNARVTAYTVSELLREKLFGEVVIVSFYD